MDSPVRAKAHYYYLLFPDLKVYCVYTSLVCRKLNTDDTDWTDKHGFLILKSAKPTVKIVLVCIAGFFLKDFFPASKEQKSVQSVLSVFPAYLYPNGRPSGRVIHQLLNQDS